VLGSVFRFSTGFARIALPAITGLVPMILIMLIIFGAIKLFTNNTNGKNRERNDDAQILQDICEGLDRMEERINSLETILTDKDNTDKKE
jgi:phage shock protein B